VAVAAVAAVTASVLIPTEFRVSAKAVLEGRVQRAVPAPFEGFIATAPAKAGDMVHAGDVLATLDDHDLQLDRVRWQSERERLILKSREAMSKHDPGTSGQLDAQLRQTDAQIALTAEKLKRTRITSPIDGMLVSGDMSQLIGAPIETGKVLYEVAPLEDYRVIVRLDERDIRYVRPGQSGHVLLQGMTGDSVPFTVQRITSVAETDSGHNTFRVEGTLVVSPANLRPGMEGIGKIEIAEHSYAWVWTRGLRDWLRMLVWNWTP
jgi:multidrug resistance efflux pump